MFFWWRIYKFTSEKIKKYKKNTEIEGYEFHQYNSPILINDVDINEIVVSNKFPFGKQDFEYYVGYKDNKEIRPLGIYFPEMSIHKIYSDKTKSICILWYKMKIFLINIWQFGKMLAIYIKKKKKLKVNLYIIKNI